MKFPEVTLGVKNEKDLPRIRPQKIRSVEADLTDTDGCIVNDKQSAQVFRALWGKNTANLGIQERMYALVLDAAGKPLAGMMVAIGGTRQIHLDVGLVAALALATPRVTAVVICHNHPSGRLTPSDSDKALTIRLRSALELIGIQLLDHIIINPDGGWLSMIFEGHV